MTELMTNTISVIVADDDPGICEALADLLGDDPRFLLVGIGASGAEGAALAEKHRPHLAIVDVQMPQGGIEAIRSIGAVSPHTRIAVYSAKRGTRVRAEMLEAGAVAFLSKGAAVDLTSELAELFV